MPMQARAYRGGKETVGLLGFGAMRLPRQADGKTIDEDHVARMVDYALDHGVDYFDTAWGYHDGESERVMGRALARHPRGRFRLATKMPTWEVKKSGLDAARRIFPEQLAKCQVDYFDYYLLHAISGDDDVPQTFGHSGALAYLEDRKAEGQIRRLGFSFHGTAELLERLLDGRAWDFVQLQINYLDWNLHDARRQYEAAASRGVPVVVMEPVRGGALATLNADALAILQAARPGKSAASWALRFVASLPGVLTVLSGMSNLEQVEDNVKTLSAFEPVTDADRATLDRVLEAYLRTKPIPCTACRYCLPCPAGVEIPTVLAAANAFTDFLSRETETGMDALRHRRTGFHEAFDPIPETGRARHCTRCGQCAPKCPQHIDIPGAMTEIRKVSNAVG